MLPAPRLMHIPVMLLQRAAVGKGCATFIARKSSFAMISLVPTKGTQQPERLATDVAHMQVCVVLLPMISLASDVKPAFAVVTPEELSDQNTVRLSVMLVVSVLTFERFLTRRALQQISKTLHGGVLVFVIARCVLKSVSSPIRLERARAAAERLPTNTSAVQLTMNKMPSNAVANRTAKNSCL